MTTLIGPAPTTFASACASPRCSGALGLQHLLRCEQSSILRKRGPSLEGDQGVTPAFRVAQPVAVACHLGFVHYVGAVNFAPGTWVGVELNEAEGLHDGMVRDTRYFTCEPGHGVLVPETHVTPALSYEPLLHGLPENPSGGSWGSYARLSCALRVPRAVMASSLLKCVCPRGLRGRSAPEPLAQEVDRVLNQQVVRVESRRDSWIRTAYGWLPLLNDDGSPLFVPTSEKEWGESKSAAGNNSCKDQQPSQSSGKPSGSFETPSLGPSVGADVPWVSKPLKTVVVSPAGAPGDVSRNEMPQKHPGHDRYGFEVDIECSGEVLNSERFPLRSRWKVVSDPAIEQQCQQLEANGSEELVHETRLTDLFFQPQPPPVPLQEWELEKLKSVATQVLTALHDGRYTKDFGQILLAQFRGWRGADAWAQAEEARLASLVNSESEPRHRENLRRWIEASLLETLREVQKEVHRGKLADVAVASAYHGKAPIAEAASRSGCQRNHGSNGAAPEDAPAEEDDDADDRLKRTVSESSWVFPSV